MKAKNETETKRTVRIRRIRKTRRIREIQTKVRDKRVKTMKKEGRAASKLLFFLCNPAAFVI